MVIKKRNGTGLMNFERWSVLDVLVEFDHFLDTRYGHYCTTSLCNDLPVCIIPLVYLLLTFLSIYSHPFLIFMESMHYLESLWYILPKTIMPRMMMMMPLLLLLARKGGNLLKEDIITTIDAP